MSHLVTVLASLNTCNKQRHGMRRLDSIIRVATCMNSGSALRDMCQGRPPAFAAYNGQYGDGSQA